MKDITFHGYTTHASVQAQAMPFALSGRDLLGCAETGSAKTATFTIPVIQHCLAQPSIRRGDEPFGISISPNYIHYFSIASLRLQFGMGMDLLALVLAPTRELAQQIEKESSNTRK